MSQLRSIGDHVIVPHGRGGDDLAEAHLVCQFLDGVQSRFIGAVHWCNNEVGVLEQVGNAGVVAVFLSSSHRVCAHIPHIGFPAAVGQIPHHTPFQTTGVYQNRACRNFRQGFLYHLNGNTLVQAENDHVISAVCHSAGAVDRSVGNGIVQNCLLYVTSVNGMGSGCFYRFADRAADQSHANY